MVTKNKMLEKVYKADSNRELKDVYESWAADYDTDAVENLGYVGHITSANALDQVLGSKDAFILDAGCGTGLVGIELTKKGYHHIDALDYSQEMLEESRRKNIYQRLFQADMNLPLAVENNRYHAVICSGSFSYCHIKATAFDELVRITKPGGYICFTIREGAYDQCGYREQMSTLEKQQAWELVDASDSDYMQKEGVACKLFTYRVLP